MDHTFIMLKPDAVERCLVHTILNRFLSIGFEIKSFDCLLATDALIERMYADNISVNGNTFSVQLHNYYSGKIVVPLHLGFTGDGDAIFVARSLIGVLDPVKAVPGTIRHDFGNDSLELANSENRCCYNLVHGASSYEEYLLDLNIWSLV